jgi:hypothetical protein
MTSVDFLEKVYKILHDQDYRITFSPARGKNWMMNCNGHFIGGLFDEELCIVYTDAGNALLHDPEPVYRGYSKDAQHKMMAVPLEAAKDVLRAAYRERFAGSTLVYDITCTSRGAAVVEDFYDEHVIFLKFCHDNQLLKEYPLDNNDRIIRMVYYKQNLTKKGITLFCHLTTKFCAFYDNGGKSDLQKMLKRWLAALEKKYMEESQ